MDIGQVETLCLALFEGSNEQLRADAQLTLLTLQSSVDFIPVCRAILDSSSSSYAQLTAANSLESLVTQFWNNFTTEYKHELRTYVLNYLLTNAPSLLEYVVGSLTKLACRITKLGWFDSQEHRNIIGEVKDFFFKASIDHYIVGLKLLNALVDEMNVPTAGRTLTVHRKTAVSFRDQSLLEAFEIAVTTLKEDYSSVLPRDMEQKLCYTALTLANTSLSFDFIGTNPEESAEDVGTVQVPSSWRPYVQDPAVMQLFFDRYEKTDPPHSHIALQALVQLSSVRRSLFASEKERSIFLEALMQNIRKIMSNSTGLYDSDNYHEFCRLLGRLKASYQLSELTKTTGFTEWLELACEFTVRSLANWQYSMNSIHYLLALWGRLIAALPYLRVDAPDSQKQTSTLRNCVLTVVERYITTMLNSADYVVQANGSVEDPLDDEGSLKEQMERLPVIARLEYETVAKYLIDQFEQSLAMCKEKFDVYAQGHSDDTYRMIKILEGRLTWLTYMVAAVIGNQTQSADTRKNQTELLWDGRLSKQVFLLVQLLNYRLTIDSKANCDPKLEIAILNYFKSFKKAYVLDNVSTGSSMVSIVPGGAQPHHLLSLALSSGTYSDKEGPPESFTVYDAMEIGDVTSVMNIIVDKICNNIRYWGHRHDKILTETLEVFVELVTSYSSSKTLLSLEAVSYLVQNHDGEHFPFLGFSDDNKDRITFYSALSRLVFSSSEDLNNQFDVFIASNLHILSQLSSTTELRNQQVKLAIIGAMRDLRGITTSAYNKRTYNLLFDAIFPLTSQLLVRIAQTWYDDAAVMAALFKFVQEFVSNKAQRICFDQSSANGILLFRQTSEIVCAYGSRILAVPVQHDIYLEKYKGIRLMLNTLTCALSGNYVCFGVFGLYDDRALQNALDISLQTLLNIPQSDILQYVKLSKAYYGYLEVLFRNHLDVLSGLDSPVFLQLVKSNYEGLQSSDPVISAFCASTVDHLATYLFLNCKGDKVTVQYIRNHLSTEPDLLHQLMATLFNTLLFTAHANANHWALTRPILSLLLADESSFNSFKENLIMTQTEENQIKLREEFSKLTLDIQQSLEAANRDRFTQRLTEFRIKVRNFLTL